MASSILPFHVQCIPDLPCIIAHLLRSEEVPLFRHRRRRIIRALALLFVARMDHCPCHPQCFPGLRRRRSQTPRRCVDQDLCLPRLVSWIHMLYRLSYNVFITLASSLRALLVRMPSPVQKVTSPVPLPSPGHSSVSLLTNKIPSSTGLPLHLPSSAPSACSKAPMVCVSSASVELSFWRMRNVLR